MGDQYVGNNGNPAAPLSFAQLEELWISNGGSAQWAPLMAGIALSQSGGVPNVINNTPATGDYSVGFWQINYFGELAPSRTQEYGSATDLAQNENAQAQAAIKLLGNGAGLSNWTGDTVGQVFMNSSSPPSEAAVLAVVHQRLGVNATGAGVTGSTPTQAVLTSSNSSSSSNAGVLQTLEGVAASGGGLGGLFSLFTGGGGAISGAVTLEDELASVGAHLISTQWWLRVGEFVLGAVMVIGGLVLLVSTSDTGEKVISEAPDIAALAA